MEKRIKKHQFDSQFFIVVIALLAFGLIMVFSSSSEAARSKAVFGNDPYFFIKRQGLWAVISIGAMFFFSVFNYKNLKKLTPIIFIVSIVLLVLTLAIGSDANGGKRWINLGFISFQPSEVAKIAVILFFANSLAMNREKLKSFKYGFLPYIVVLGLIVGLVILEKHLSATIVIVLIGAIIMLSAGAKIRHFMYFVPIGVIGVVVAIMGESFRMRRIISFLDPFAYKMDEGWQVVQSLYAISSGGIFGLGLGQSRQKFSYIPEPQNDFIFSITCEELGLIGAILVIGLFAFLIYRGIRIAISAPDVFSSLVATGIMAMIGVEVVINIAVVTSSMPVTGMPLPFFSYGGTTLLMNMSAMGIMLNISRYTRGQKAEGR